MTEIQRGKPRPADDTYRILVLDGQKGHLDEIVKVCKELGQEVVPVTTIREGKEFLETKDHVDVVVVEAFLEDENVFDFLRMMKSVEDFSDVPVMIMAAEPGEIACFFTDTVSQTLSMMGACKFLLMPKFDVHQLMREIKAILPDDRLPKKEEEPGDAY